MLAGETQSDVAGAIQAPQLLLPSPSPPSISAAATPPAAASVSPPCNRHVTVQSVIMGQVYLHELFRPDCLQRANAYVPPLHVDIAPCAC